MLIILEPVLTVVRTDEGPGNRYRFTLNFKIQNDGASAVGPVHIHLSRYEGGYLYGGLTEQEPELNSIPGNSTTEVLTVVKMIRMDSETTFNGHFKIELTNSTGVPVPSNTYAVKQIYLETTYACTDTEALNYNRFATEDDGTCQYIVYGCTDPAADNYDPAATNDDGTCTYTVYGCTDPNAINYNPNATEDDGTCEYSAVNTGMKAYATLEQYDTRSDEATGREKPNSEADPHYIEPISDPDFCPIGQ